ncbi:MAG: helix-turn-helix domain-containing protein [Acidimicrobiales bacterium]
MERLPLFKALGDNTRYAIYLELARAAGPRATAEVADALGLHPNTVRPHLERMREVGLLQVAMDSRGSVGRPQHRYLLAPDAPSLGLEPPAYPLLAGLLANVAAARTSAADDVAEVGRHHGRHVAAARAARPAGASRPDDGCAESVMAEMADMGFDPVDERVGASTTIAFTNCPYRELAEAFPELVCELHRGMMEGMAEAAGAVVARFSTLADREPCRVELVSR